MGARLLALDNGSTLHFYGRDFTRVFRCSWVSWGIFVRTEENI